MLNSKAKANLFSINKSNIFIFHDKDHGNRESSKSVDWAINLLNKNNLAFDEIKLITMPRILGYLFNPVSFWLCYHQKKLISVIAEVNNTFKETHSYICHKNGDEISDKCWFKAQKDFHVSPFYPRQGYYKFCIRYFESFLLRLWYISNFLKYNFQSLPMYQIHYFKS
jgi:hypothetical protein